MSQPFDSFYYPEVSYEEDLEDRISYLANLGLPDNNALLTISELISLSKNLLHLNPILKERTLSDIENIGIKNLKKYVNIYNCLESLENQLSMLIQDSHDPIDLDCDLDYYNDDLRKYDYDANEWVYISDEAEEVSKVHDEFESCSYKLCKQLMPTFKNIAMTFLERSKLFRESIDIDAFLIHIYNKRREQREDAIIKKANSIASEQAKKINPSRENYETSLFSYLEYLKTQSDNENAIKAIYKSHNVGERLNITDGYIKQFLLSPESTDELHIRIMATIMKLNYLKEKCGDIKPEQEKRVMSNTQNNNSTENDSQRIPQAILATYNKYKLIKKEFSLFYLVIKGSIDNKCTQEETLNYINLAGIPKEKTPLLSSLKALTTNTPYPDWKICEARDEKQQQRYDNIAAYFIQQIETSTD